MGKEKQRLDKILAHMGLGTRKEIKQLVRRKQVQVNGELVKDPGHYVYPEQDLIEVNGEQIHYREYIYIMLNKPQGFLSATEDSKDKTVVELLAPSYQVFQPFPVGRLDKDTEGLLILTNDGQLAHRLLAPKRHVPKTYLARVDGVVTASDQEQFRQGVVLDDGCQTLPAQLKIKSSSAESEIELIIYEGKYHQVKRMFAAVGKKVTYLKRIAMGPLSLDPTLKLGAYRELTEEEVKLLQGPS
ncbi:pseudouridine synthase [Bacillota bacterium LX-D]|nr:pseudouridine synthase [Bacillota bacterium LX-D]